MMENKSVPPGLTRTVVYRKVPIRVRCRLDRLILSRPKGCATEEAITQRLKLTQRYGVSVVALKRYARQLEKVARPLVASQLTAAIVGCLLAEFRRSVADGSQALLLGKVVQTLNDRVAEVSGKPKETLSIADLAKLATVLKAIRPPGARRKDKGTAVKGELKGRPNAGAADPDEGLNILTGTLRALFGLQWPLPSGESQQRGGEAGEADKNALAG